MKTETITINEREHTVITADEGKIFVRKHDGTRMGKVMTLGYDYSTGEKREDLPEYYAEIEDPNPPMPTDEEKIEALKILGVEL